MENNNNLIIGIVIYMPFNFYYAAGFLPRNLLIFGEKNGMIEAFVQRLCIRHRRKIIESEKIIIVQNSTEYQKLFTPMELVIGSLEELNHVDYSAFKN